MRKFINFMIISSISFLCSGSAYAEPKEEQIEDALLQQLHPAIVSSLRRIYEEQYSQYQCERITVGLVRPSGEYLEINLKNDTVSAQYYLVNYKKGNSP